MRTCLLVLFALLPLTATADGDDPKDGDGKKGHSHDLTPWMSFEVEVGQAMVTLKGKAPRMPDGVRLKAGLLLGGAPVKWKRAYVMKHRFLFQFPRQQLRPGTYEAVVTYEGRDQIADLAPALKKAMVPPRYEQRAAVELGGPVEAAEARLAETRQLRQALAALQPLLDQIQAHNDEQRKKIGEGYDGGASRKVYEKWLRDLDAAAKAPALYRKRNVMYRKAHVDSVLNVYDKAERYARGLYREELIASGVKPNRIPMAYRPRPTMLNTPAAAKAFVAREQKRLGEELARAEQADVAGVEAAKQVAAQKEEKKEKGGGK